MQQLNDTGYFVHRHFAAAQTLQTLRAVAARFHAAWQEANAAFYADKAINSAYLTGKQHLNSADRTALFAFIGSHQVMQLVQQVLGPAAAFMNTQLFFDPVNTAQKNYWHRDPQYHLSLAEQQAALQGPRVMHFRLALYDEPGLELIPGSHARWDTPEELAVRLEQQGRNNHEALPGGVPVSLNAGDLLVFCANLIHRGRYGMGRQALDILFCDPVPELLQFVEPDSLPEPETLSQLENPSAFQQSLAAQAPQAAPQP